MKKLCAGFLAVLLVGLCGCRRAGQEVDETDAATTTTEVVSTTEAPTTTIPVTHPEIQVNKNDPYSYVIKAYDELARNRELYWNEGFEPMAFAQGFKMLPATEHLSGFDSLYHMMIGENQSDLFYALYDINGDGRKELLLGAGGNYGQDLFDIYTIRNGVAVQQINLLEGSIHPRMSILRNGTVMISGGHQGWYSDLYYRFKKGSLQFRLRLPLFSMETDRYYKNWTKDHNNDVEISKEEWERLRHEFEGDRQEVSINWTPLWAYGQSYTSYREAYKDIANGYVDSIQYAALSDVLGDNQQKLIFVTDNRLFIWMFNDGKPQLIFDWSIWGSSHSDISLWVDKEDNLHFSYIREEKVYADKPPEKHNESYVFTYDGAHLVDAKKNDVAEVKQVILSDSEDDQRISISELLEQLRSTS